MEVDRLFTKAGKKPSQVAFRYSAVCDGCVVQLDDETPEFLQDVKDELDFEIDERIKKLTKQGYKPAKTTTLPEVQSPAVIEAITGLEVPASYAKFLASGKHKVTSKKARYEGYVPAAGTIDGVPNFADGAPIIFCDPAIPFWLSHWGYDANAPTVIPIALFESGRAMGIDAETTKIVAYDNSASEPVVEVAKTLAALLKRVKA